MQDARKIFISLCAGAYSQNTLTERNPIAPQTICREVQKAGGNIRWLSADSGRQHTFHFYYCEHVHKAVPFDKVWSNANKNQSKDQNKTKEEPKEPSRPTPFERAVQIFLRKYADSLVRDLPRPQPPKEVRQRYRGKHLREWEKIILKTNLFRSALKEAREAASRK
jgi:hypothetical protein